MLEFIFKRIFLLSPSGSAVPKKKNILKTLLITFLVFAVTGSSLTLASAMTSQSAKEIPKTTYVTGQVQSIYLDKLSDSNNSRYLNTIGITAAYSEMLGESKFSLSFYSMPQPKAGTTDDLSDSSLNKHPDYYEIKLTKVIRKYGNGHYIDGLFTMTKNNAVCFENQPGYLGDLPPYTDISPIPDYTKIIIPFEKDSEQYALSTSITFVPESYEAALGERTIAKEFTLSRGTKEVRLGKIIEASVDGKSIDVSELNQELTDNPHRPAWYNYSTVFKYNSRLNEASVYLDLVDYYLSISSSAKADCDESSVKADFKLSSMFVKSPDFTYDPTLVLVSSRYLIVNDVLPVTVTGLDNEPGGFIEIKSDDGKLYLKQEIVPFIEKPLSVYGTREPEEFYTEGEAVLIGTPREQDDYDIANPGKPIKRIIVDNNRKVLAVVPLQYQVGYLHQEAGCSYIWAGTWEDLFSDRGIEEGYCLLRYDPATFWIKAIIPSDCIYYKIYR